MTGGQTVKAYPGASYEASQAMFAADSAQAASMGWTPVSQAWDGTTLIVTYGPMRLTQPAPTSRRRRPWLWVVAITGGVLVVGALASGGRRPAGTGAATAPPTVRPTARPALVMADDPTVTTRTSVGNTITIELKVRNDGKTRGEFVVGMKDLSTGALFVGCDPECEDLGESFTGQVVRLPGPLPGKTRDYTITWQALKAARVKWSMWLSVDDDSLDMDDDGWDATTVIVL